MSIASDTWLIAKAEVDHEFRTDLTSALCNALERGFSTWSLAILHPLSLIQIPT
jgi:hypothetical protein